MKKFPILVDQDQRGLSKIDSFIVYKSHLKKTIYAYFIQKEGIKKFQIFDSRPFNSAFKKIHSLERSIFYLERH